MLASRYEAEDDFRAGRYDDYTNQTLPKLVVEELKSEARKQSATERRS